MYKSNTTLLLSFILFFLFSCTQSEDQQEFENNAFKTPSGITETNTLGEILSKDPDDWRVSPLYATTFEVFRPAYPNPSVVKPFTIEFLISGIDAVPGLVGYVLRQDRSLSSFYRHPEQILPVGLITIEIDPSVFAISGVLSGSQGVHRVLFYDLNNRLITYGDVKVES